MKVEFIDHHKGEHGVQPICDALVETDAVIAPSTYYARQSRPASARSVRDAELTTKIHRLYGENYRVYGARRKWAELRREGHQVARCTVERPNARTSCGSPISPNGVVAVGDGGKPVNGFY